MVASVRTNFSNVQWVEVVKSGTRQFARCLPGIPVMAMLGYEPISVLTANVASAIFFNFEIPIQRYLGNSIIKRLGLSAEVRKKFAENKSLAPYTLLSLYVGQQVASRFGYDVSYRALLLSGFVNTCVSAIITLISLKKFLNNLEKDPFAVNIFHTFQAKVSTNNIVNLTAANFAQEVIKSNLPVVVCAYAKKSLLCHLLAPYFIALSNEMQGKVKFLKLNIDENPDLAKTLAIEEAVPTLIFYKDGVFVAKNRDVLTEVCLAKKVEEHLFGSVAQAKV